MRLIITLHASQRMTKHGIDENQIIRAIKQGAISKQTDGLMARYTYIEVAYKVIGDRYIIKTVKILK